MEYKQTLNLPKTDLPIRANSAAVEEEFLKFWADNNIYKKLLEKDRDISKIYDIIAKRIIVPTIQDCYATLGILHQRWKPLKGRIKDYIAQPKPNGYQSLHTTVFCEDGEIVEFQIRTPEIHEEAEFGIAAHWFYTEHGKKSVPTDANIKWLKDLAEIQKNIQDPLSLIVLRAELKELETVKAALESETKGLKKNQLLTEKSETNIDKKIVFVKI